MNIQQSYDEWASQYDNNINRTRDLEAKALRDVLGKITFDDCLEIGCGTGKNTVWLAPHAKHVTSVDLSEEMLAKAKEKISCPEVNFICADITAPWSFADRKFGLVSFSLVLEHIEDLNHVFSETATALNPGGHAYIGELHPFKQYSGSKARFETAEGTHTVQCFDHHVSDFLNIAKRHGLELISFNEYFDEDDSTHTPRLLVLLLRKR